MFGGLSSKRVARICQHKQSFLFILALLFINCMLNTDPKPQ